MCERTALQLPEQRHEGERAKPMYHRSISTRLRWSYLISSTLPLLLVGTLLIVLNFRTQQRSVYDDQITLAERAARDISAYISNIETQVLRLGPDMSPGAPSTQQEMTARGLIDSNAPDLRELIVFDSTGREIARFSWEASSAEPVDRIDQMLVSSALEGRGRRSDIQRTDDGQAVFMTVLPLRNQGEIVGAISAQVNATRVEQLLRPLTARPGTVTFLINAQREIMLQDSSPGWRPPASLDVLFDPDAQIAVYDGGNGQPVVGARASIGPSTNRWWVIVERSTSEAFANIRRSVLLLAMLVIVAGLLAFGVGLWQGQKILRPLSALRKGAQDLGAGHLEHRIDVASADEMGQLAQTFNQMAGQLQASLSKIELQNEHLRKGLTLARDIQMGLLPTNPPWNQKLLEVQARSIPAYEVGGDFYSYLSLPNDRAAIAVGDISGKGVAAALLMALTSSTVEAQARHVEAPADVFGQLNRLLSPRLKSNRMNAALVYAVFDLQAHTMTVANAGMIAPLLVRANVARSDGLRSSASRITCEFLDVGGMPIGAMPNALYQEVTVILDPGDTILFMSDGVVEAQNAAGELFGFERLELLVTNVQGFNDMTVLVSLILKEVQEFIGQAEQHDDLTIVAVRPSLLPRIAQDHARGEMVEEVPLRAS